MRNNSLKIFIPALIVLSIVGGCFLYLYLYLHLHQGYLIQGVPYYGVYNHWIEADSTIITSVAEILGYWGDKRFDLYSLKESVFPTGDSTGDGSHYAFTISDIERFFRENGYQTYLWKSGEPGGEIEQIKEFVNPAKKIPVIVYQKRSSGQERVATGFRVVIGIFDNDKRLVVHDHDFGNNYEISYDNFENMFAKNSRAILAVWPSENLASKITGPNYNLQYPARTEIMNEVGEVLMIGADALFYDMLFYSGMEKDYGKVLQLRQEVFNDPRLSYFPPAQRIYIYSLCFPYLLQNNPDELINLVKNKMLPINNNLSKPDVHGTWTEQTEIFKEENYGFKEDRSDFPYILLAWAYYLKGNKELARENLEEALEIRPLSNNSKTINIDKIRDYLIREVVGN